MDKARRKYLDHFYKLQKNPAMASYRPALATRARAAIAASGPVFLAMQNARLICSDVFDTDSPDPIDIISVCKIILGQADNVATLERERREDLSSGLSEPTVEEYEAAVNAAFPATGCLETDLAGKLDPKP